MKGTRPFVLAVGAGALMCMAAIHAGGWNMIVSVRDLPEYAIAGSPLHLTFMVRQLGVEAVGGLAPTLAATAENETVTASAIPTRRIGRVQFYARPAPPGPLDDPD